MEEQALPRTGGEVWSVAWTPSYRSEAARKVEIEMSDDERYEARSPFD